MASWEQPPPYFGVSGWIVSFPSPCPNSEGKSQLFRPSHQSIYSGLVGPDGSISALHVCSPYPRLYLLLYPWGRFRTVQAQRQLLRCFSREHPCKPPPYRRVHDSFQTASGVQRSGPWDLWLPAVESSRLFEQRMVRPP